MSSSQSEGEGGESEWLEAERRNDRRSPKKLTVRVEESVCVAITHSLTHFLTFSLTHSPAHSLTVTALCASRTFSTVVFHQFSLVLNTALVHAHTRTRSPKTHSHSRRLTETHGDSRRPTEIHGDSPRLTRQDSLLEAREITRAHSRRLTKTRSVSVNCVRVSE